MPDPEHIGERDGGRLDPAVADLWRVAGRRAAEFDRTAAAYDRYRPGYPDEMFDAVAQYAGLDAGSRLLEVGAGTGIATIVWAARGLELVCVEPTAGMAALLRDKTASAAVAVHEVRFEDWQGPDGAFDAVFASDAWHWIDPTVGFAKAHAALRPGGTLALVWHSVVRYGPPGFVERIDELRRRMGGPTAGGAAAGDTSWATAITETGLFGEVTVTRHRFSRLLDGETFVAVSNTYGRGIAGDLPDAERHQVEREVVRLIERDYGGAVEKVEEGVAYLARRLPSGG